MPRIPSGAIILCLSAFLSRAADTLTLNQAIEIALKNNVLVLTEKNKAEIGRLNNSPGNAGMLPRASAIASASGSISDVDQKLSPTGSAHYPHDTVTTLAPSVTATWTLFDGTKMFATKARLKQLQEIGELNFKDTLQTVVALVIEGYYDLVSGSQELAGFNKSLEAYEERLKIADKQYQVGTISEGDFLQAKVDLNEQKSQVMAEEQVIIEKKIAFNLLLSRPPDQDFSTGDSIPIDTAPRLLSPTELGAVNFQLRAIFKNIEVARYARNEAFAQFLPDLLVAGGYGLSLTNSSQGQTLENKSFGFSGAITLSVPLFNGFSTLSAYRIADLNLATARVTVENARLQIESKYYQSCRDFERARAVLKLEEENIGLAEKNLAIALSRFRLGQSTSIEMRTAEVSYTDAITRLVTARFNTKFAETELKRMAGDLVK